MSEPVPRDPGLDPDQRLMARVREGDRAAFEALYDRFGSAVMHFLHGLCQDRHVAEDLTQETFVAAWTAAPRWRPAARVSTWLFQIAKLQWWKRSARRRARRRRETGAARRRGEDGGEAPGRASELADEVRRLREALLDLSPRLRLVFVLVRLEGLPYAEVARVAGLRPGTVKSRMAAAEAALRRRLRTGAEP